MPNRTLQLREKYWEGNAVEPCAICGDLTFSWEWDLQLFLAETGELVCDECGDQHSPALADALRRSTQPFSYRLGGREAKRSGWPWDSKDGRAGLNDSKPLQTEPASVFGSP